MSIAQAPAPPRFIRLDTATEPVIDERSPRTLSDEHSLLLREVRQRTMPLLARLRAHTWPAAELRTLVRYLRTNLLRHISDEEVLLFPRGAPSPFAELRADHGRLYGLTELLDRACEQPCSATQLGSLVEDLLTTLERHQHHEQAALAALPGAPKHTPGITSVAGDPRPWLSTSDDPVVIDLDDLCPERVSTRLCIERLLRLRRGETAQILSSNPAPLRRVSEWMRAFDLLRYDISLTPSEQGQSRLQVTRRTTP
jgi:hypothetical protein